MTRQNNELREENLRLQDKRSRSTTRSRSRSSRSTSRRSQSSRRDIILEPPLDNIAENFQINDGLQDPRGEHRIEKQPIDDRYVHHGEDYHTQEGNRGNIHEQQGERYHVRHDQDDENDSEQGRMILHGREMLRHQHDRADEAERHNIAQIDARDERERRMRRR
ncbi:uncharacterized protein LOC113341368 [Papaver somniferum]|uniref:uncharacterized protein LOC113341368 n=1 Tax=Papaver somniferum TaxID=3469 RepID=UPI000E6F6483|nr:uncharacterized protein LOC113341368 [Papaver somniferum]